MKKRILSLVLACLCAASVFAGCGKTNTDSGASNSETPTKPAYEPNLLTGEAKDSSYVEDRRPVAIMINNITAARPQRGLTEADVLFEIQVEGGITRFMGLFQDYASLPDVGPVRSGRDQFFQLIRPLQALYLHIGRSAITQQYINDNDYNDLDVDGANVSFTYFDTARHNKGYQTEHCSYTNGEELTDLITRKNIDMSYSRTSPVFDFVDYSENGGKRTLSGEAADTVSIRHSTAYRTYFDYDPTAGLYLMSQYNKGSIQKTIDENNNKQVSFENVFVLFTEITSYPYPGGNIDPKTGLDKGDPDYKLVDYSYGGVGYYFSGGKVEEIRWRKGPAQYALQLTDKDGNSLKVNCGKSYVAIVDLDEYENFSYGSTEATPESVDQSELEKQEKAAENVGES